MNWLNDAHLTDEDAAYNPEPVTAGPGSRYTIVDPNNPANLLLGVLNVGGGPPFQDKGQQGRALQEAMHFFGWAGNTLTRGGEKKSIGIPGFQSNQTDTKQFTRCSDKATGGREE